jgi:hypothetical protein
MQNRANPRPAHRNKSDQQEAQHRRQILRDHQRQIADERRVAPAFVKVFEDAPGRPKTGQGCGDRHRNPTADLLFVPTVHQSSWNFLNAKMIRMMA